MSLWTRQRCALHLKALINFRAVRAGSTTNADESTHPPATAKEHFDIIIGGGGLVGTTLAAALGKNRTLAEKKVLLLEGAPEFKGFDVNSEYGNRVSAINRNAIGLFETIGAWEHMKAARVKSVKQMQVWEGNSDALIQFQHEHFATDIACVIENDLMLDAMYAQLQQMNNVQVLNRAHINSVCLPRDTGNGLAEVHLEDGRCFTCELLVGADGSNSLVRKAMKVDVFSLDYKRMGLVATLKLSEACDNSVAWQRFIPTGPVALLPLNEQMSSLVWSTTIPHAKQLVAMPDAEFVDALNEAFCKQYQQNNLADRAVHALNSFFGHAEQSRQYPPRVCGVVKKSRATFPLGFLHASSYVCNGAVVIGDAAHRIHPLAGQGVNLGYGDVRNLVDTLGTAVYAGAKLGDKQYLKKYEQRCLTANVPVLIGVHGLQALYSTSLSPVVVLRSLGLQLTHNLPTIKNLFIKRAMG